MNGRSSPWWIWLVLGFVVLGFVSTTSGRLPVLPLVIGAILLSRVLQRRSGLPGPQQRREVGHGGTGHHPGPFSGGQATSSPPQDRPMPTIDVPHYPGDGGAPGPTPPSGYGTPAPPSGYGTPAPPSGYGTPAPPVHVTPAPPPPGDGAPHTSSDPVVSLGRLHLSRCGRDLQAAAEHGTAAEVARVLDEVADLSRRMQEMLGAVEDTAGSGRREFQAGLRALDRLVEEARDEEVPGARLTRVTQACLRMGQTGRHE